MSSGGEDQNNNTTLLQGSRLLYLTQDGNQSVGLNSYLDPSTNAVMGLVIFNELNDPPNQTRISINNQGITETFANGDPEVNVSWENFYLLKQATPALRIPDASNIFVVSDTYEANDDNLAKTRKATLSAVASADPTLALEDLTSGEKATITQDTLTYLDASGGTPVSTTLANIIRNCRNYPSYFEDFTGGTLNGTMGTTMLYRFTGGGAVSVYEGATLNANIQSGYNGRIGAIVMNSTAVSGDACLMATEETFRLANVASITYGFNNCGNELPTTVANGTDFGNGDVYMGLTSEVPNDDGSMSANTTIIWRYSAPSGTISNWTLVENNVVKETLTGTNLTGALANKWIRCSLYFINGGTQYYGIFNNLTNGAVYQTNTYTISGSSSINTNVCSVMGVSTSNSTLKCLLMDYVLIEPNTLPIDDGLSQTTSR